MKGYHFILAVFSCLYWLVSGYWAAAQSYYEKDFVHYTTRHGLSDNNVNVIQQDENGYIWIGTEVGLNCFDGNRFIKYHPGNKSLPLRAERIRKLKRFSPHELAIIGDGGLLILNTTDFSSKNYLLPDSGAVGALWNRTWDAVSLPGNNYALSTAAGFYLLDEKSRVRYSFDAYRENDIGNRLTRYGRNFFRYSENELLLYNEEAGLSYFNLERREFKPIKPDDKSFGVFTHPRSSDVDHWVFSSQISATEFIFVQYSRDSIFYYDKLRNLRKATALPFRSDYFGWNSNLTLLNDSTILVNMADKGFISFRLDRETGKIFFNPQTFLPSFTITHLFIDKDNRLWAGTTKGLLCQKLKPLPITTHLMAPSRNDVQSVGYNSFFRHKDKLYMGRNSMTLALVIADASSMKIEKEISFEELWQKPKQWQWNQVRSIQMYHTDTLWIGTNAGIIWFDTKTHHFGKVKDTETGMPAAITSAILAPPKPDGYAWMVSILGGKAGRYHIASRRFEWFTEKTIPALPFSKVKNISYDSYGDVWISGHGLTRWNNRHNRFDTLIKIYGGPGKYNDDIVAIAADDRGSLWMHNAGNGLLEYKISEKKWLHYSTAQGLPNAIFGLSPVVNNILWVADNTRLIRFNTFTKNTNVFTYEDGVSAYAPTHRKIFCDSNGKRFYYASENEVVSFTALPDTVMDMSSELLLQELNINSRESIFEPKDGIRLKPDENNLFLRFTVIDYESSDGYQFSYKLNEEEDWQSLGNQRMLVLSKMPAGNYELLIKATGKSGAEKIKSLQFTIAAPLLEKTWFRGLAGFLFVIAIVTVYRFRINQVKQIANFEKQMAEMEIKGLHAQMNPHFIFNSLNSIKEMILEDEKANASRYLSKFAQLIRSSLEQSRQTFITVKQCAAHMGQYLAMEELRFGNLEYSIQIEDPQNTEELQIPPMLVQPLAENAIWHGLRSKGGEKKLFIRFYIYAGQLICEIEDNGIGYLKSLEDKSGSLKTHRSLGITNIYERLKVLNEKYDLKCSLSIKDKSELPGRNDSGTIATLKFNL